MVNFFFATLNFLLKIGFLLIAIVAALVAYQIYFQTPGGVVDGVTPIDKMRSEPRDFENKTVEIEGIVTRSYGIFSAGIFTVQDEASQKTIDIITTSGVPVVQDTGKETKTKWTGLFRPTITINRRQYPFLFVQAKLM